MKSFQDNPEISDGRVREFHLRAELRRAAMWTIGGCLLIVILGCCLEMMFLKRGWASTAVGLLMFILLPIGLLFCLLTRIRIDEHGISRRILWWWDLWPWEVFTDGHVHQGIGQYHYLLSNRPWWSRKVDLGVLDDLDAKSLDELIRRIWQPPSPAPFRDSLTIRLSWPDSRQVVFNPDRIIISRGVQEHEYRWQDVPRVVIWRLEAGRCDFRELHLHFTDQKLHLRRRLHQGSEVVNWKGVSAETLAAAIVEWGNAKRVADYSLTGPSKSLEEVEARQKRLEPQLREFQRIQWIPPAILIPVVGLMFVFGWPKCLIIGIHYIPLIYAVRWMVRDRRKEFDEASRQFEAERVTFLAER